MRFSATSLLNSNATCLRLSLAALAAIGTLSVASSARAQVYLVGAELFGAASTGATTNPGYQYDTNSVNTEVYTLSLTLNGTTVGKGALLQLAPGANNFTINLSPQGAVDPGSFATLGLFLSTSATSYDPSATARPPDLVFSSAVADGTADDFTPVSGTQLNSFNFNGSTVSANGLTSASVGGAPITVSNLAVDHSATGSFTINDGASAPEPAAVLLASSGIPLIFAGLRVRRRISQRS